MSTSLLCVTETFEFYSSRKEVVWEHTVAYFSVKWIENILQKCFVQDHKEKMKTIHPK